MTHHDGSGTEHEAHDEHENGAAADTESHLDRLEEREDRREEAQTDESLGEEGLLPVPKGMPADGQAPGA